jgi:hypothetical protein
MDADQFNRQSGSRLDKTDYNLKNESRCQHEPRPTGAT